MLGAGCVEVIPHRDDFDAGPDVTITDASGEPEVMAGKCMSGKRWGGGMMASQVMTPGQPCMAAGCHSATSKTAMTVGGTVYPLGGEHDDNDCNGIDGTGVAVVPMDDMGNEIAGRIQVNAVGNFWTNKSLPQSYKVKVIQGGRDAIMIAPVTNGDCNFCHQALDYMGAKGRIVPAKPP